MAEPSSAPERAPARKPQALRMVARARTAWQGIVADIEGDRQRELGPEPDRGPAVAFVGGALCLVLMEYAGGPPMLSRLLEAYESHRPGLLWGAQGLYASRWLPIIDLTWWVCFRVLGFFVLPALAIRTLLRKRVCDFGLSLAGLAGHGKTYALLFAVVLPFLLLASTRREFVLYYPFYKRAHESVFDLVVWELMYAGHFFALEFFFRGFWLTACRRSLGVNAVYAMVVPYCMIHFTKPVLEVLGAVPAGLVLGLLAMQTRSIWGGVLVHVAVAWTMDLLALVQGPGLPTRLWPS